MTDRRDEGRRGAESEGEKRRAETERRGEVPPAVRDRLERKR